jgi:chromate reductase, NAD(P)H dehydrogenase (quinone)
MHVLAISGSLRRDSHNTQLLRAAAQMLPPGVELALFDGLGDVPPYNEDADGDPAPAGAHALRAAIRAADALLISTPEYNASVPGVLKNAVDWASRPYPRNVLRDKPVAVMGASTGLFGAVWSQAELRKSLRHTGAHVLDEELPVGLAHKAFTPSGRLADPELERRLADLLDALAREVQAPLELAS